MKTTVITWTSIDVSLPDADANVLLGLEHRTDLDDRWKAK